MSYIVSTSILGIQTFVTRFDPSGAVHKMASDKLALRQSALQKLNEFKRLGYPPGLLRGVCNFMGATTGEGTWIGVRNAIT